MQPDSETADAESAEGRGEKPQRVDLLHRETSGAILGAFFAVHSELGSGFLEAVYANALTVLLEGAGLKVERQVPFDIVFHGEYIGFYRADLVVQSLVVVEVKAAKAIHPVHTAQLLNYLKASRLPLGLLLNFGETAQFKRVIRSRSPRPTANAEDAE